MDPRTSLWRRRFGTSDCLYRSPGGTRVVADCEGQGRYRVLEGRVAAPHANEGSFTNGLVLPAVGEDPIEVVVACGDLGAAAGEPQLVTECTGPGWAIRTQGPAEVDDQHELAPEPSDGFPLPFFRRIACPAGAWVVLADGLRCDRIDWFEATDPAARSERNWVVQNAGDVIPLASAFPDGTEFDGFVFSHLNRASWDVLVPEGHAGLILRKRYDRFHGRQRARVLINGRFAAWWTAMDEDRARRWAWSQVGLPASRVPSGKVRITIDPPAGTPLWSVSCIEAWALMPASSNPV